MNVYINFFNEGNLAFYQVLLYEGLSKACLLTCREFFYLPGQDTEFALFGEQTGPRLQLHLH